MMMKIGNAHNRTVDSDCLLITNIYVFEISGLYIETMKYIYSFFIYISQKIQLKIFICNLGYASSVLSQLSWKELVLYDERCYQYAKGMMHSAETFLGINCSAVVG